jgi:hypothetical protein
MLRSRPTTNVSSGKKKRATDDDHATAARHQRESLLDEVDQTHHQRQSLMDESDQDQMILDLKAESDRLQQHIHQSFSFLCVTSLVVCVLVTLYLFLFPESPTTTTGWVFRWLHTGLAALLHWEAQYFVKHPAQPVFSWKLLVPIVSTIGLLIAVSQQQHASAGTDNIANPNEPISMLHWGLVLSNAVTLAGAAILRLDSSSTANSLEELKSAKYRYKSL